MLWLLFLFALTRGNAPALNGREFTAGAFRYRISSLPGYRPGFLVELLATAQGVCTVYWAETEDPQRAHVLATNLAARGNLSPGGACGWGATRRVEVL